MKNLILILTSFTLLFINTYSYSQDSLLQVDLSKYVYHFDIEDGQITGDGAAFLQKQATDHQYFLIGEYHGSPRISNFTNAMIPILSEAGFEHFGLEVGPESVKILEELSADSDATVSKLKAFNSKYNITESDGYVNPGIPFFESVEDATFLAKASEKNWKLLGLDQEYWYCFIPLVDRMYTNLNSTDQKAIKNLWMEVKDSIHHFYKLDENDTQGLMISLRNSKVFNSYIKQSTKANNKNKAIADAMMKTIEIYGYIDSRQYLKCNDTRINYMKENLRKQFERMGFDLQKDKMVLKMGGVHTARGFSWLSLFELGNTLNELANFYGNKSINMTFQYRFYIEDGKEIDALADKKSRAQKLIDFVQYGKKDQWTIIDLRPLKSRVFYNRQYKMDDYPKEFFKMHDLIIIPKMEMDGTPNY